MRDEKQKIVLLDNSLNEAKSLNINTINTLGGLKFEHLKPLFE